ncbi:MAG: hypothetical protein FGM24_06055 [Candidatus Kapabacteria bacterium]|nr:hypothetical protein [Candidatus Kapabacteria bacterium]
MQRHILLLFILVSVATASHAQLNRWTRSSNPGVTTDSRLIVASNGLYLSGPDFQYSATQGSSWTPCTGTTGSVVGVFTMSVGIKIAVANVGQDEVRLFYSQTGLNWESLDTLPQKGRAVGIAAVGNEYIVVLRDGRAFKRTAEAWKDMPATGLASIKHAAISDDAIVVTDGSAIKVLQSNAAAWQNVSVPAWTVNSMRLDNNTILVASDIGVFITGLSDPALTLLRVSTLDIGPILSAERHLGMFYVIGYELPTQPNTSRLRLFRWNNEDSEWLALADTLPAIATLPDDRSAMTAIDAGRMVLLHRTADTASSGVYAIDLGVASSVNDDAALGNDARIRDGHLFVPAAGPSVVRIRVSDMMGRLLVASDVAPAGDTIVIPIDAAWLGPVAVAVVESSGVCRRFVVMP